MAAEQPEWMSHDERGLGGRDGDYGFVFGNVAGFYGNLAKVAQARAA